MTIDEKDVEARRPGEREAGQGGDGVDTETGEISQARLDAQRELEAFIGRVAGRGGQAAGGAGNRRRSKHRPAGGMSPLARRLLRLFLCVRYPLVGAIAIFAGPSFMRGRQGRGGGTRRTGPRRGRAGARGRR